MARCHYCPTRNSHFLHSKRSIAYWCSWDQKRLLFIHETTIKWKFASSMKKMKPKKSGWSSVHWLMVCPKACHSALFASVWSYGNRWRSWCIVRITELGWSVSWDKRLVILLGNCSKYFLTLTLRYSVLDWP